ncbi:hypothetical protein Pelo_6427 [Pelomyxa schiedti]|nr:hypothetical protein Pelo_6427 [Pelomyxa schiedti]
MSLQVLCINLDRRPDRWAKIQSAFSRQQGFNLTRIPAIDGTCCPQHITFPSFSFHFVPADPDNSCQIPVQNPGQNSTVNCSENGGGESSIEDGSDFEEWIARNIPVDIVNGTHLCEILSGGGDSASRVLFRNPDDYVRGHGPRIGVWLSHVKAWIEAIRILRRRRDPGGTPAAVTHRCVVIIEDDVIAQPKFMREFERIPAVSKLMSNPESIGGAGTKIPHTIQLGWLRFPADLDMHHIGTHAYLITLEGAQHLLKLFLSEGIVSAIDWQTQSWDNSRKARIGATNTQLITQLFKLSDSNISRYRSAAKPRREVHPTPIFATDPGYLAHICTLARVMLVVSTQLPGAHAPTSRLLMDLFDDLSFFSSCVLELTSKSSLDSTMRDLYTHQACEGIYRLPIAGKDTHHLHFYVENSAGIDLQSYRQLFCIAKDQKEQFSRIKSAGGTIFRDSFLFIQGHLQRFIFLEFIGVHTEIDPDRKFWRNEELPRGMQQNTGVIALMDWTCGTVIAAREFAMPQGVCIYKDALVVAERRTNNVTCLNLYGVNNFVFSHPMLANVHSIERNPYSTSPVYLLTSSDTDRVFEFGADGQVLWEWDAFEHGFNFNVTGKVSRPPYSDYRPLTCHSNSHGAHPNSAAYYDVDTVLVTLYHHGTVVKINKRNGTFTRALVNLRTPHSIRRALNQSTERVSFTVVDTRGKRVLLLSTNLEILDQVGVPTCAFLQDAILSGNSLFCSLNLDIKLQLPMDDNFVAEIDITTKLPIRKYKLGRDTHLYSVTPLSFCDAAAWSQAWLSEQFIDRQLATYKFYYSVDKVWFLPHKFISVYLHGSRVRHISSAESDWDFFSICEFDTEQQQPIELNLHDNVSHVDACIIDAASMKRQLAGHNLWRVAAIFSPGSMVLKEAVSFRELFTVEKVALWKAALYHSTLHYHKAAKKFALSPSCTKEALKKLFHALLLVTWALDCAKYGRVVDQSEANPLWEQLQLFPHDSWAEIHRMFLPIFTSQLLSLASALQIKPTFSLCPILEPGSNTEYFSTQRLIWDPAKMELNQHSAIRDIFLPGEELKVTAHREYFQLYMINDFRVQGAIIDTSQPTWRFVSLGRIEHRTKPATPETSTPAPTATATPGLMFYLYHYDGRWKLASSTRPDSAGILSESECVVGGGFSMHVWSSWSFLGYRPPTGTLLSYAFSITQPDVAPPIIRLCSVMDLGNLTHVDQLQVASNHGWNVDSDPESITSESH